MLKKGRLLSKDWNKYFSSYSSMHSRHMQVCQLLPISNFSN